MSIKLRKWEEREQIRTSTEKMKHWLIVSREKLYVTIALCSNILRLKAVNVVNARQTRKHDVIKLCSIDYLTTEIEFMLPTFKSWTVHKIKEYITLGLLSIPWNIYHSTTSHHLIFYSLKTVVKRNCVQSPCTYTLWDKKTRHQTLAHNFTKY